MGDHLLIVDDDKLFAQLLGRAMRQRGFSTYIANSLDEAKRLIADNALTHALIDLRLGSDNGLDLVAHLRSVQPCVRSLVLTGYGNVSSAVAAVKAGAADYLAKPSDADEIEAYLRPDDYDWSCFPPNKRNTEEVRVEHIIDTYERNNRNVSATARQLSMHRRTLQRILRRFELNGQTGPPQAPTRFGRLRRLHSIWRRILER